MKQWSMRWGPGISAHRSFYLFSPPYLPLPKMGSHLPVSLSFFYSRQGPGCRAGMNTKSEAILQAPVMIPKPKGSTIFINE